jgi:hypothetical protein
VKDTVCDTCRSVWPLDSPEEEHKLKSAHDGMHLMLEPNAVKPEYLNLHAVVTGVLRMSGQAEYIARIFNENYDVDPVFSEKLQELHQYIEDEAQQYQLLGVYEDSYTI